MRIYVGNLAYDTTEGDLKQLFTDYGTVASISLPIDRDSGRPRGYGFVEMPNKAEAEAAIASLNKKMYKDRALTVNEARPRAETVGRRSYAGREVGGRRGPRRY